MLTVKVMKDNDREDMQGLFSTKIVEADEVNIYVLRPSELYEVAGSCGGKYFAFYVANRDLPRPTGFADEVEFWYVAYVENAAGATTAVVKFS